MIIRREIRGLSFRGIDPLSKMQNEECEMVSPWLRRLVNEDPHDVSISRLYRLPTCLLRKPYLQLDSTVR